MKIRRDGSIQSSLTPTVNNVGRSDDDSFYRCMVTKVIYVDDPNNITTNSLNARVLYDVVVLGGFASGQLISNCRLASELAGTYTFYERILKASTKEVTGTRLSDTDGDIVFVQFVQGHTGYPVIVALDNGIAPSETGAKLPQGPRSLKQYNGVRTEINNDGEFEVQVKGGTADPEKGGFVPSASPLVTLKATKDQKYTRVFRSGLSIIEDGANDIATLTTKGGLKVVEDGRNDVMTVTTAGGVKVIIDGRNDNIKMITSGGAELHLRQAKVSLGVNDIELLDELSKITKLVSDWARDVGAVHTHPGVGIPDQSAEYVTLADNLDIEKGKVDQIKGTL